MILITKHHYWFFEHIQLGTCVILLHTLSFLHLSLRFFVNFLQEAAICSQSHTYTMYTQLFLLHHYNHIMGILFANCIVTTYPDLRTQCMYHLNVITIKLIGSSTVTFNWEFNFHFQFRFIHFHMNLLWFTRSNVLTVVSMWLWSRAVRGYCSLPDIFSLLSVIPFLLCSIKKTISITKHQF